MIEFLKDANEYLRGLPGQTKSVIGVTIILCVLCVIIGHKVKKMDPAGKTPLLMVPVLSFVGMINGFIKENIGKRWRFYAPLILSLTMYIFFANICGIFGFANPTNYLVNTAALATVTFLMIQISGIVSTGLWEYFKAFFSPSPLLFPINLISEFSLPVSLALRLFGNIMSGAVLAKIITGLLGVLKVPYIGIVILPAFNLVFDIAFGVIQTAVFILLSVIFTGAKIKDEDKIFIELEGGKL